MKQRTFFVLSMIIMATLLLSSCGGKSVAPGITQGDDVQETPKAQSVPGEEEQEEYQKESLPPDQACDLESVMLVVSYDHLWTWSPDGTEATGAYIGEAKGGQRLLLLNDGNGNLSGDSFTIFYYQDGFIQGDPDRCDVVGNGMAEFTLSGTCQDGVMELEWMEVGTSGESTMVCGPKTSTYTTFYPAQAEFGIVVDEDGLAYRQSNGSLIPNFYGVSMEWTIRVVPPGQAY